MSSFSSCRDNSATEFCNLLSSFCSEISKSLLGGVTLRLWLLINGFSVSSNKSFSASIKEKLFLAKFLNIGDFRVTKGVNNSSIWIVFFPINYILWCELFKA